MKLWLPVQTEAPAEQRVQEQERVRSGQLVLELMMNCLAVRAVAARLELARGWHSEVEQRRAVLSPAARAWRRHQRRELEQRRAFRPLVALA